MEPVFANHPTGLLIANPGLPYEPPIGLLPPSFWLVGHSAPTGLAFGPLTPWPSARPHPFTGLLVAARPPFLATPAHS